MPDDTPPPAPAGCWPASTARTAAVTFSGRESMRQVVTEMDDLMLFVPAAGPGPVLAVLAAREAEPAVLGYEMTQLVRPAAPFLSAQPRTRGAAARAPRTDNRLTGRRGK